MTDAAVTFRHVNVRQCVACDHPGRTVSELELPDGRIVDVCSKCDAETTISEAVEDDGYRQTVDFYRSVFGTPLPGPSKSSGWDMDDDYRRYSTKGGPGHYQTGPR